MAGIAGIIKKEPGDGIHRDLSLLVESMRHETYYVGNQYVNPDIGLYVGWLSHPCSLAEPMPLISHDKRLVLIVVGENHSAPATRALQPRDGENLLQLYEELGERFLDRLNGWFCGVLLDLNQRKITLFNDRFGMERIYFHEGKDEFIFASEAKSLLRLRPVLRTMEPEALAQYLRFNCVLGNKSLFKGISVLPAASSWTFEGTVVPRKSTYFDYAQWEDQSTLKPEDFCTQFDDTMSRLLPSYMDGPPQVGISLTAGLDSRLIMASAKEQKRFIPCYTFGGLWGETFDIRAAKKVARICNQPHQVISMGEQFLREFPSYAQRSVFISDGTHDAFGAHDLYFNQIAREIAPVRLTGKFGSEVVGTRSVIPSGNFPRNLLQPGLVPFLDAAPSFHEVSQKKNPLSSVVSEELPWFEFGRMAVERSQLVLRTPYMDNELVKLMYQAPPSFRASRYPQVRYTKQRSSELASVATDLGKLGNGDGRWRNVFHFLFAALAKSEYIYLYSTPHWLTWADRRLEKLRPERIFAGRQKFEAYRIWIKTHLAGFVRQTLLSPGARCADFFDKRAVAKVVAGHTAGTHNYLSEINKMLTIELICSSLLRP